MKGPQGVPGPKGKPGVDGKLGVCDRNVSSNINSYERENSIRHLYQAYESNWSKNIFSLLCDSIINYLQIYLSKLSESKKGTKTLFLSSEIFGKCLSRPEKFPLCSMEIGKKVKDYLPVSFTRNSKIEKKTEENYILLL